MGAVDWAAVFPRIDLARLAVGAAHFDRTVALLPDLNWQREGTLLCAGRGRSRVGYAIRQQWCCWHFRQREAVALYRAVGGRCRTTEVTISFGHRQEPDYPVIAEVITMVWRSLP